MTAKEKRLRGPAAIGPNPDHSARTALNSGPAPVALGAAAVPLALSAALIEGIGAEGGGAWIPVLPPADADGRLPTRNGSRLRMADPAALAAALNAQLPQVRLDFDHTSERISPNFDGSTAADGWFGAFRATPEGGIEGRLDSVTAKARDRLPQYRYVSPATMFDQGTREVIGLSSVAAVNDPNMPLRLPEGLTLHDASADGDEALKAREEAVKAREDEAAAMLNSLAEQAVDKAVADKRFPPAHKDHHLLAIKAHPEGVAKGVEQFNALMAGSEEDPTVAGLDARKAPEGDPKRKAPAPRFTVPDGARPPSEERLALHAKIQTIAQERNLTYAEAVSFHVRHHGG